MPRYQPPENVWTTQELCTALGLPPVDLHITGRGNLDPALRGIVLHVNTMTVTAHAKVLALDGSVYVENGITGRATQESEESRLERINKRTEAAGKNLAKRSGIVLPIELQPKLKTIALSPCTPHLSIDADAPSTSNASAPSLMYSPCVPAYSRRSSTCVQANSRLAGSSNS